MAGKGKGMGASAKRPKASPPQRTTSSRPQQVIPDAVASRMARRVALATGIPTLAGMGVFVASYLLVSRGIAEIPPGLTLVSSGGCFLLGLIGLSYGVLSASWDTSPGSMLGGEQIGLNVGRLRESLRAMRAGKQSDKSSAETRR